MIRKIAPPVAVRKLAFVACAYALIPLYRRPASQIAPVIQAISLHESGGLSAKPQFNLYALGPTNDYGIFQMWYQSSMFRIGSSKQVSWMASAYRETNADSFESDDYMSLFYQCVDFVYHQYKGGEKYNDITPWAKRLAFEHHRGPDNEQYWEAVKENVDRMPWLWADLPALFPLLLAYALWSLKDSPETVQNFGQK
jgi:hypothetical protein